MLYRNVFDMTILIGLSLAVYEWSGRARPRPDRQMNGSGPKHNRALPHCEVTAAFRPGTTQAHAFDQDAADRGDGTDKSVLSFQEAVERELAAEGIAAPFLQR